ncbi:MAG: cation transporter dimerization domain-containing protein [Clostridia bacterium]|nr:cation transporter dimerization domain-containing protein [Clostridia bacterium]
MVEKITEVILQNEHIIGVHDLIIHTYGPGNMIGSCHVEVKSSEDIVVIHDIIDEIERKIHDELNILMTIHMDPIETDNIIINKFKEGIGDILREIDPELSFHDLRMVSGNTHTNLIFDVVVPYSCKFSNSEIKNIIDNELKDDSHEYYTVITFDQKFVK